MNLDRPINPKLNSLKMTNTVFKQLQRHAFTQRSVASNEVKLNKYKLKKFILQWLLTSLGCNITPSYCTSVYAHPESENFHCFEYLRL